MSAGGDAAPHASVAHFLEDAARRAPRHPYLYFGEVTVSLAAFEAFASRTARALATLGVRRGDRVALVGLNSDELLATFFAAHKLGAAAVPLNPEWTPQELSYALGHSEPRVVLADAEALPRLAVAPGVPVVALAGEGASVPVGTARLAERVERQDASPFPSVAAPDDLAFLYYTSGTTGRPKGVPLTHANVLSYYRQSMFSGDAGDALEDSEEARLVLMVILPLFHVNAMITCVSAIARGITVALRRRFSAREFWPAVERHRVNVVSAVPTIFSILLGDAGDADRYDRSSLMMFVTGAAAMPPELLRRFEDRFGVTILEGYGLTEGTVVSAFNPIGERKIGSVGKPLPGQEIAILADDGTRLGPGRIGEVCIRGENVMRGYYKDEAATRQILRGGLLHTGDVGYLDGEGYLFLSGRKKDLIIRGGENIAPVEVENALLTHPDVAEAAVVGRPDPTWGETVHAVVVARGGAAVEPEALKTHAAARLARFKVPESIELAADLPRNAMGKVLKRVLRDRLAAPGGAALVPVAPSRNGDPAPAASVTGGRG